MRWQRGIRALPGTVCLFCLFHQHVVPIIREHKGRGDRLTSIELPGGHWLVAACTGGFGRLFCGTNLSEIALTRSNLELPYHASLSRTVVVGTQYD